MVSSYLLTAMQAVTSGRPAAVQVAFGLPGLQTLKAADVQFPAIASTRLPRLIRASATTRYDTSQSVLLVKGSAGQAGRLRVRPVHAALPRRLTFQTKSEAAVMYFQHADELIIATVDSTVPTRWRSDHPP